MPQKGQQIVREFIDYYRERLIQMWEKQDFEILPFSRFFGYLKMIKNYSEV